MRYEGSPPLAQGVPARPLVTLTLGAPPGRPSVTVEAVVDTGADVTILRVADLVEAGANLTNVNRPIHNGMYTVDTYHVPLLSVAGVELRNTRVFAWQQQTRLVGRDILNRFVVQLDPAQLTVTLSVPS